MRWKKVESLNIKTPSNISVFSLRPNEVPWMIKTLKSWYPGIRVGSEAKFIELETYKKHCFLKQGQEHKPYYPVVFRENDHEVGLMVFSKEDRSLRVSGITGAVNPAFRGSGFAKTGPFLVEAMGQAIGAEFVYYYGSLQFPQTQVAAEKMGFKLVGILPSFELDLRHDAKGKKATGRVTEAIYAKVLADSSRLIAPDQQSFTPHTQRVWDAIFEDSDMKSKP